LDLSIRIRRWNVDVAGKLTAKHRPVRSKTCRVHRAHGHTVVGILATDDLGLLRLALIDPEKTDGFDCAVVRLTATGREEKMIDRRVTPFRKSFRQLYRRNIGLSRIGRSKRQLLHLFCSRLRQLFPSVTEGDVP